MEQNPQGAQGAGRQTEAPESGSFEDPMALDRKEIEESSPEDLFSDLSASEEGLSEEEAQERLETHGPNALEEKKRNPVLKFLSYFWGPIPWMIEHGNHPDHVLRGAGHGGL